MDRDRKIKMGKNNGNGRFIRPSWDEYFIETYGLELLAGENLIKEDTVTRYLATESFAKKAGFENPAEFVGTYI
ncbi:MAG: hypothetical protein ACK4Z9_05545, partial [Thermodesulfovibrionales bacterium]